MQRASMGRKRAVTSDERHSIRSKNSEGLSVTELARLFKRSSQTINKALQEVIARNAHNASVSAARVSAASAPAVTPPLQLVASAPQRAYHQRAKPPAIVTTAHSVQHPVATATATAASATRLASASSALARDVQQAAQEAARGSQTVPPHTSSPTSLAQDASHSNHEQICQPSAQAPAPQAAPQQLALTMPPAQTNPAACQSPTTLQSHETSTPLAPVRAEATACTANDPAKARRQPATPSTTAASAPAQPAAQPPRDQQTAPVSTTTQAPPVSFVSTLTTKSASSVRTQPPQAEHATQAPTPALAEATAVVQHTAPAFVAGAGVVRPAFRPVVRPPRVVPHVRAAPTLPQANSDRTSVAAAAAKTPSGAGSVHLSPRIRTSQASAAGAATDVGLMELLLGTAPDDDSASPQTSQDDGNGACAAASCHAWSELTHVCACMCKAVEPTSQSDSTSQAKSVTHRSVPSSSRSSISKSSQQHTQSNKRGQEKQSPVQASLAGASSLTTRPSESSSSQSGSRSSPPCESTTTTSNVQQLMASLQAQVAALQQRPDSDDRSALHDLLSRVQDELRALDTKDASVSANRKRKRESDFEDNARLGRLLHDKLAAEVEMLRTQAARERVVLDRERLKSDVEAALSRKRLEDAAIPKEAIERILASASARG